jgi:HK97 family phage major capsid protein
MELDQNIVQFLNDSSSEFTSNREANLKRLLIDSVKASGGDFLRAFDIMMIHDEELRNEFNYLAKRDKKSGVNYNIMARGLFEKELIDEKTYKRAAGVLDTVTNPGGANFLQTTVADFVAETVDELGLIAKEVEPIDLAGDGNLAIPTYNPKLRSAFVANSANYPELTALEPGIGGVTINTQKVGSYVTIRADYLYKLSASKLQFILRILADAQARAYDDAILNANGTLPNPLGMNQNALNVNTDFQAGSNIFDTLLNAISAISDRRQGRASDIRIFMNTSAKNEFVKLERTLSNDRQNVLVTSPSSISIAGYPVIVSDVILNTNGSIPNNKTSIVTVGYAKQYYWGSSRRPTVETNNSVNFLNGSVTARIDAMADGRPAFNDAFAKFTVTTGVESV